MVYNKVEIKYTSFYSVVMQKRHMLCTQGNLLLKGTVSRDFLLLVFFMNQFPPSPRVSH